MCHAISIAFGFMAPARIYTPYGCHTPWCSCLQEDPLPITSPASSITVDEQVKIDGGTRLRFGVSFRNLCSITSRNYVNSGRNRKSGGR